MKNVLPAIRESRSFIAGILIGLSVVVPAFAWMEASTSHWQILSLLSAPVVLALGITLQSMMTAKPRRRPHQIDAERGWTPVRQAKRDRGAGRTWDPQDCADHPTT